jgi:hypothetical protein
LKFERTPVGYARGMRAIETIDADLRFLSRAWRAARDLGEQTPVSDLIDQLLDERAAATDHGVENHPATDPPRTAMATAPHSAAPPRRRDGCPSRRRAPGARPPAAAI